MGIIGKLRVLFWALIVGLWGIFMYQYITEDLSPDSVFYASKNPFKDIKPQQPAKALTQSDYPDNKEPIFAISTQPAVVHTIKQPLLPIAGSLDIKAIASPGKQQNREQPVTEAETNTLAAETETVPEAPRGFATLKTKHFIIYEEGTEVSEELARSVEHLHGNIMLDLVAFSPWTRDKKIFLFFAGSQSTYQRITGRPAWSGGTATLRERKVYLFKSDEAMGILAHELTHIYFDSFFASGQSPLWLSEGMATYVQSARGNSTPSWLEYNLQIIERGGGFKLNDLIRIDNMRGADEDNVRLWYAQSYSLVRFLSHMKAGEAFYLFCKNMRDGAPVHKALYQSYGMPYNKLSALEYAWRYDLKTGKIIGKPDL